MSKLSTGNEIADEVNKRGHKTKINGSYHEAPIDDGAAHIRWAKTDRPLPPKTRNWVLTLLKAAGLLALVLTFAYLRAHGYV